MTGADWGAMVDLAIDNVVRVENGAASGPVLVICEHASNAFPAAFGTLGLTQTAQSAHIAWDPGALGLARGLAERLNAPLVAAQVSRLIFDCNRPPDAPGAMTARSETYDIPGNQNLDARTRQARTRAIYVPFHATVSGQIADMLARGLRPVLVTVHSFTPEWFGQHRAVEFGIIHDADPALALNVLAAAQGTNLRAELNEPYSAADGVTHTLRLHAGPYGLANVMLEIRNDLIGDADAETAMADKLAPVLSQAIAALSTNAQQGVA